ncbi:pentatricopeptide repeat-containing protein, putative [Ricinus communis]|uniref:Pentatricopeptide repeat-containing protein, putative n=1 Tax=Ricinus communis TaxID=3988 RepID=B9S8X2_RICCO|nr:pentatricopeptide repeat-containing protein, putative [Ricinus communis]
MYTECNDVDGTRRVFDKILEPCVISYNAIIMIYARSNRPNEALALFRKLQAKKLKPTDVIMLSVLLSCAFLGALDLGKWVNEYVKKNGFDKYVKVNTALISMYAKCGSLDDAISAFQNMRVKHTETCHTGLVDEGLGYFYSMSDSYGIMPRIKHYGCTVDLLSRAGHLDEAYKFVDGLPIKPIPILWRTLLSACSSHGNLELGKQVLERIFELDDSHGGDYVILSNMCARAGKWEDVDSLRKLMIDRGAVKIPGCSLIEVNSVVHEFFSGEGVQYVSITIHEALDELVEE